MPELATDSLFRDCPYPVAVLDLEGEPIYANRAWDGFWSDWQNGDKEVKQIFKQWLAQVIEEGSSYKDFYATRQIMRVNATYSPKHQHLKLYGQVITETAQIDSLTHFPRLFLLKQRMSSHLQAVSATGNSKTVLVILDIKGFKELNLRYSYATGDTILIELAKRLRVNFPQALCMGRIAGNEFAIAYETEQSDFDTLSDLDERLLLVQAPMLIDDLRLQIAVATGVVISEDISRHPDQLLAQAQLALNHAREHELSQQVYCPKLASRQHRRLCIREELDAAIAQEQFTFVFEPQVLLSTGAIVGAEVLTRWLHPTLGKIPPVEFILEAEKTGKITKLTCFVIEQIFEKLRKWQKQQVKLVPIAINISAQDILTDDLWYLLSRLAQESPVLMRYLQLEITETCLLRDIGRTLTVLSKLKQFGITIAIDDFGTGYSSLSYLSRLAADTLKIDRSFVSNLFLSSTNQAIVQSILDLAKRLQMQVCAEGVETLEQANILQGWGCYVAQGYYFHRSLDEQAFLEVLMNNASIQEQVRPIKTAVLKQVGMV